MVTFSSIKKTFGALVTGALLFAALLSLPACSNVNNTPDAAGKNSYDSTKRSLEPPVSDTPLSEELQNQPSSQPPSAETLKNALQLSEDYRASFMHGNKDAAYQKYIVLHDTEGDSPAEDVVNYWDSNAMGVAAHFIINKDGSIVQCVDIDTIAHHAGFGDTGHNDLYGVADESRDDKVGTQPIGSWASDYGMNSYSIGIELVHRGGEKSYPEAQLNALDALIAYIDTYYGFESTIIDHKAWRSGNSDTSPEFASYLENYQQSRTHITV